VATYYAAVRLELRNHNPQFYPDLRTENWHTGCSCPVEVHYQHRQCRDN